MAVEITNRTRRALKVSLITKAVETTLRFGKIKGDVSVVIVGDTTIRGLNKIYRKKDKITDILSFREAEAPMPMRGFVGELIVDYAQIKRQSVQFKHSVSWELAFIVIHGTLHLIGYEDDTERGRVLMEKLGYQLIKKLFANTYV